MGTLNDKELIQFGESLREKAQREVDLIRYMLQHADATVWAKADQAGLKPGPGDWVVFMNQHRTKLAASKAEAGEILRLCRKFYGHGDDAVDYLEHALRDPVWALRNLRVMAGETGLTATTSDGVGEI